MGFLKNLFGGKPSVEEKAIEYQKKMVKATMSGSFNKLEKIETEYGKWLESLSEDDQKKAAKATIKWGEGEMDSLSDKLKNSL